jgi:tight adherence protein B
LIAGSVLIALAGMLAGLALISVERATVIRRATRELDPTSHRHGRPRIPGLLWRWWPLVGAATGLLAGGVVTALLGGIATVVVVGRLRRRRGARLSSVMDEQLADAVRSIAAAMRAGLSVPQAIAYAAREADAPLAGSFASVVDRLDVGGELEGALQGWATAVGTDDARLVVGVLALHRRTGGDLPVVLDQVAATLRERVSAAREVRALTAQARLSGAILGFLPIGFFGFLWLTSRGDIQGAFHSSIGVASVVVGLILEGVAFLWIRSLLEVV